MINHISILGILMPVEKDSNIRKIRVRRNYKNGNGEFEEDIVPFMYWNKTNKNALFNISSGALVALDGRIEVYDENLLMIVESYTYIFSEK